MNNVTDDLMKRVTLPIIVGLGILLAYAPAAQAHKADYRPRVTYDYYFAYDRSYSVPRWVRKDRGFRQWFLHSRYSHAGHARRQNWHRLYDLYLYDRQMHRHSRSYYRSGATIATIVLLLRRVGTSTNHVLELTRANSWPGFFLLWRFVPDCGKTA